MSNFWHLIRAFSLILQRHALVFIVLTLGIALFVSRYQFAINLTESLSGSVFLIDKSDRSAIKV